MSTAIEFNHVGKQYRLGLVGTGTLSHDLNRWWQTSILHHEDPYLKIGDVNDRAAKATSDYIWALRDIDFKVEQGDVVGIIGKNGAGKSTLLKLLSRVTAPTVGTINARGRIASLLEVGTGFHSEMTGRENIYMNGAILGMTKQEISAKLDEIIAFSGCEKYIDTPVKRYSSGMTVRLGFAVAAFLEPEILVVDEVLAVGDAEFQKKAIGKMQDVASGGRTVLFVSHNMASIRQLCKRGVLLNNGMVEMDDEINKVVDHYLAGQQTFADFGHGGTGALRVIDCKQSAEGVSLGEDLVIDLTLQANRDIDYADISFDIHNEVMVQAAQVSNYDSQFQLRDLHKGQIYKVRCVIKNINLAPGTYSSTIWVGNSYEMFDGMGNVIQFYVTQNETYIKRETPYGNNGGTVLQSQWCLNNAENRGNIIC